ncbi:MAG: HPP family protein [Elusimicrobiota bacterium]
MIKVKDCIKEDIIKVRRGTPLKEIIKIFNENKCTILPVVDEDNKLVGKITLDEITSVFQPQSAELNQLLKTIPFLDTVPEADIDIDYLFPEMGILVIADEIMSNQYFTVKQDDTIAKAYSIMKVNDTQVVMVVKDDNDFVGIIGMFDIIYAMFKEKGVIK